MLAVVGMGLTGFGTILAIVHPTIGARWASDDTRRREWDLRYRYYIGVALIIVGTILQVVAGWPKN